MKKSIIYCYLFFALSFGAIAQLKVDGNGNVGICQTAPQFKLDVRGHCRFIAGNFTGTDNGFSLYNYCGNAVIDPLGDGYGILGYLKRWGQANIIRIFTAFPVTVSDEKIKENIRPIANALNIISQLNSVQYDLKKEYFDGNDETGKTNISSTLPIKNRIGFIAQEVKLVLPEIVVFDSIQKLQGIIYENLIPVLSQAINEQQAEIEELKKQLAQFEVQANSLKSASIIPSGDLTENMAVLNQNVPNPFSSETRIDCIIPEGSGSSVLYIYNMNGTQLQQYSIKGIGEQSVTISGNTLEAGMYIYALVIDGREVDTKRMILTK